MLSRFGAEIVVKLYTAKAFYLPSQVQTNRYIPILGGWGYAELWTRIVVTDYNLIVKDRIRILTTSDRPDDNVKHSILATFSGSKDVIQVDDLIRSFYLTPQSEPTPFIPPTKCDINTMSPWDFYKCINN